MRKLIHAFTLAFALGGAASAFAGEGCNYSGKTVKKNDLETPPPAASVEQKKG